MADIKETKETKEVKEVKESIVRSKRKNQLKELERCKAIYGEENAVTIDRTTEMGKPLCNRQGREQGRSNGKVPGLPEKEAGPLRAIPRELSGRVLVCWCWPEQ